jgi:uncharacterized membrane protein
VTDLYFGADGNKLISRRMVMFGAGACAAIGTGAFECQASGTDPVRERAQLVAEAMQAIHGGTWSIQVNHKTKFVSISQDFT